MSLEADIAIIGGGIAGPALACALAGTGLRIVLAERDPGPLDTARGDHLQPATVEQLARWGVLERLVEKGAERRLGAKWWTADGELVLDARADDLDIPFPYFLYLNHELIGEAFLEHAATNPAFRLFKPATALLVPDADGAGRHGVELQAGDGERLSVRARLVAVADGRQSRARRALGIETVQHHYANPLLVLFTPRNFDDSRNDVHAFFSAGGVVSVVPRMGEQWKIGLPIPAAEFASWKQAGRDELEHRLTAWVPLLAGIRPEVAGVYPVAMVNAARWVSGNAVLLGDACHALHPGRSQGMNVALRAVADLAERLRQPGALTDDAVAAAALAAHEAELKPPVDARLAHNHERGLEMDRLDLAGLVAMERRIHEVACDPERVRAYCLDAAGY